MSEEIQGFRFRASTRVPYGEKVRLRFGRSGPPLLAVCSDLSIEGMFVATQDLRPLGTVVEFEIEGQEGELARGLGDVVWARKERLGPGRHAGMGIQYRYVDPGSRELIVQMVERRQREEQAEAASAPPRETEETPRPPVYDKTLAGLPGGLVAPTPPREDFDLTGEVVLAGRAAGTPGASRPAPPRTVADQPGVGRPPSRRGSAWPWILLAAATLAAIAVVWWLLAGEGAAEGRSPAPSDGRPAAPPAAAAAPAGAGDRASSPVTVRSVEVVASDSDSAQVVVTLSRAPASGGVRVSRLEAPPRLLVRISEADQVPGRELEVTTNLVTSLRAAMHVAPGGSELHLVFDLAGERVRAESRLDGERLLLRLSND